MSDCSLPTDHPVAWDPAEVVSQHRPSDTAPWPRHCLQHAQLRWQWVGQEADRKWDAGNPLGDWQGRGQSQEAGPHRRGTHMPSQSYGSWPHQTLQQPFLKCGNKKNNSNGPSSFFPPYVEYRHQMFFFHIYHIKGFHNKTQNLKPVNQCLLLQRLLGAKVEEWFPFWRDQEWVF